MNKIGIVQGRLSKPIDGKIQAFPKYTWEDEFAIARDIGFEVIEFIFDNNKNPLLSNIGRKKIRNVVNKTNVSICSISCDYSMFFPLFGATRYKTELNISKLIEVCKDLGVPRLGLSFEDNSSILYEHHAKQAIQILKRLTKKAEKNNIIITLETSLSAINIRTLINEVGSDNLKINFDLGNSCALGEITEHVIHELEDLIYSVHIKDRKRLFGTTVPLGKGDVNFVACFKSLKKINFKGDIVIQGARDRNDIKTAKKYLSFVRNLLK